MADDALRTNVEQFATAGNVAFKDAVERTMTAMNDANVYSRQNLEALISSTTAAAKGAEALGAQALAFSKKTVEDQVTAAKSLANAKSVQEVVELQTTFAKTALEAYVSELTRMSETVASVVKDSMKPLNERVTAATERFQSLR